MNKIRIITLFANNNLQLLSSMGSQKTSTPPGLPESEDEARDFLVRAGILAYPSRCPFCHARSVRRIRRDKCRCSACGREWGLRKGSILDGMRVPFRAFLRCARFFADDVPVNDAAHQLGIAYNTAAEVYARLRHAVIDPGAAPASHTCARADGPSVVLFGIRLYDGRVTIERVSTPAPEIITALPVPTMQRGNILFIDAYGKRYQGFITYHDGRNGNEVVRIRARDGLSWSPLAPFWEYAGRSWKLHRGVDRERIPEYVQELALRYNHRERDLLPVVLERAAACRKMAPLVPDPAPEDPEPPAPARKAGPRAAPAAVPAKKADMPRWHRDMRDAGSRRKELAGGKAAV